MLRMLTMVRLEGRMALEDRRLFGRRTCGWVRQSLLASTAILTLSSAALRAQSENANAGFLAADAHPAQPGTNYDPRSFIKGDRYLVHDSTMADMIASAYAMKPSDVVGGPDWLEWDRFEVMAKIQPGTTRDAVRPMMQELLRERFQLVAHQQQAGSGICADRGQGQAEDEAGRSRCAGQLHGTAAGRGRWFGDIHGIRVREPDHGDDRRGSWQHGPGSGM